MNRNLCWAVTLLAWGVACGGLMAAGTPAVVKADRVNVRGKPTVYSERVTPPLRAGEVVTILEEITIKNPKPGEPAQWARIQMPANTPLWVHAMFVDRETKAVTTPTLNVRAGPGENYSVVGTLTKDAVVKEIRVQEDWMEIETPEGAYAFVASEFLEKQPAPQPSPPAEREGEKPADKPAAPPDQLAAKEPTQDTTVPKLAEEPAAKPAEEPAKPETPPAAEPALTPQPVTEQPAPTPAQPVPAPDTAPAAEPKPSAPAQEMAAQPAKPVAQPAKAPATTDPAFKRVVRREGILRIAASIQAPTAFELVSAQTRKTINFVHPTSPDQKLRLMKGRRVIVTGEELLDPRWPKTPVINLETIELAP